MTKAIPLRAVVLPMLCAATLAATTPAEAHPRSRARVGVWIGSPFWWPGYWGPWGPGPGYYAVNPVVVQPAPEPAIVPATAQQTHYWYYCREAQMYYPYVTACPSGWQEVLANAGASDQGTPTAPSAEPSAPAAAPAARNGSPVPPKR